MKVTNSIIEFVVNRYIKKKLGYDITIDLNELVVEELVQSESLRIHLDTDIYATKNTLVKLINKFL